MCYGDIARKPRPQALRACAVSLWYEKTPGQRSHSVFAYTVGNNHGLVDALLLPGHGLHARVDAAIASLPR
jgi:hypothetical protein